MSVSLINTCTFSVRNMMLILLAFSSGISIAIFTPIVTLNQVMGNDPQVAVLPFALVAVAAHYLVFRSVVRRLEQVTTALRHVQQNKTVSAIATSGGDVLRPLIETVNALIHERADLKTMRGQLVEQISAAAAQEERNRLARDLHDSIKQQVFSMSVSAAAAHAHLDSNPSAAHAALLDVKQSAQEAMVEMRALLQQLSPAPLEKSGLVQALRDQCEALAYRTGAQVETHFGVLPPDDQLPPGTQEALFRIVQEALSNVARHARARQVTVDLDSRSEEALILRISDDGQGFDTQGSAVGMGLSNIRTRAGSINAQVEMNSQSGHGTTLTINVPLVKPVEQEENTQAQYDAQINPIIGQYLRCAFGGAAFIVAFSMLMWRLMERPDGIMEDAFLTLILILFAFTTVIALPFAARAWLRARWRVAALLASGGRGSRAHLQAQRYDRFAALVISLAAAWFLPIFAIGLPISEWWRVAIGVAFLVFGIWQYQQMGTLYRRELAVLTPTQRINELNSRIAETRSGWVTTLLTLVIILISTLARGEFQIPPQVPDHWMNVSFLGVGVLLLLNQIIMSRVYRRYLHQNTDERAV